MPWKCKIFAPEVEFRGDVVSKIVTMKTIDRKF
jgi:hypothetical protein